MEDNRDSNGPSNGQNDVNQNQPQNQPQNQTNNQQNNNFQPQEPLYSNQQQPVQSQYDNQQPTYQPQQNDNQQQNQQYQYNGQPQYSQSYNNYQQDQVNNNGMAIGSLVCGIISILVNCCAAWFISLPTAIAGIILGIMSIKNNRGGRTMAIIGIVLSSIGALIGLIVLIGCTIVSSNRSLFDEFYREFEMQFDNFNY